MCPFVLVGNDLIAITAYAILIVRGINGKNDDKYSVTGSCANFTNLLNASD